MTRSFARRLALGLIGCATVLSSVPLIAADAPAPVSIDGTVQAATRLWIVQAASTELAAARVRAVGGVVVSDLSLIRGVGAELDAQQATVLQADPALTLHTDRDLSTSASKTADTTYSSPLLQSITDSYNRSASYSDGTGTSTVFGLLETQYPKRVGADLLHAQGINGAGVTIAMLDSGLWENPQDKYEDRITARVDFVGAANGGALTDDGSGHGTHVTAIAASGAKSLAGNSYGIAPGASIVVARAFDANGAGSYLDVIEGLSWIVANQKRLKIRVLNLSFSAPPQSNYWDDPLNQAVMAVWKAGIVVVASAGNSGPDPMTIGVPGNVPYVITVGALTDNYTPANAGDDRLASFSSTGPTYEGFVKPEVVAPGGHMVASMPTNSTLVRSFGAELKPYDTLFTMSGTSQSAAVTTGVVALMLQANPGLKPDDVKCRLMSAARPAIGADGRLAYSVFQQGSGLINAQAAVTSSVNGCANRGLDIAADLAGKAHFGGPANQDANGNYYVMDMQGSAWGDPVSSDGYIWSRAYTWTEGYTWSQGYVWSRGYTWSQGYVWSRSNTWTQGYTWSQGYVWSRSVEWKDGPLVSSGLTDIASINHWVPQE